LILGPAKISEWPKLPEEWIFARSIIYQKVFDLEKESAMSLFTIRDSLLLLAFNSGSIKSNAFDLVSLVSREEKAFWFCHRKSWNFLR